MEWSTFWSAVSAIFTALTAIIAIVAIYRWRKQDELKAKQAFKIAVSNYAFVLLKSPKVLSNAAHDPIDLDIAKQLVNHLNACYNAWLLTEGLLDKNSDVKKGWDYLFENHKHYLAGKITSDQLAQGCMRIMHAHFIFK